jgi:hypothetical protein
MLDRSRASCSIAFGAGEERASAVSEGVNASPFDLPTLDEKQPLLKLADKLLDKAMLGLNLSRPSKA